MPEVKPYDIQGVLLRTHKPVRLRKRLQQQKADLSHHGYRLLLSVVMAAAADVVTADVANLSQHGNRMHDAWMSTFTLKILPFGCPLLF